jgi:mannose-1-phosphate guanylyltransferase
VERVTPLVGDRFAIVAAAHHLDPIVAACGIDARHVLVEPRAANTSPATLYGTLVAHARDADAIVAVLPSDHAIAPPEAFRADLARAARLAAERRAIVTFGIPPDHANTGYGYIERGAAAGEPGAWDVASFREKPGAEAAAAYVASGRFAWNSGIFVFPSARLVDAFARLHPGCVPAMEALLAELRRGPASGPAVEALYGALEATSIDYAVMERESGLLVMDAGFSWSDLGAPSALPGLWPADGAGNCMVSGDGVAVDASGNVAILSDPRKVVALLGVEGLVVIDTPEALLVCPRGRDQEIRRVVERLRALGREDLL